MSDIIEEIKEEAVNEFNLLKSKVENAFPNIDAAFNNIMAHITGIYNRLTIIESHIADIIKNNEKNKEDESSLTGVAITNDNSASASLGENS